MVADKDLYESFSYSFVEACERLKVGSTALKRVCRERGIKRWPYRQHRALINGNEKRVRLAAKAAANFQAYGSRWNPYANVLANNTLLAQANTNTNDSAVLERNKGALATTKPTDFVQAARNLVSKMNIETLGEFYLHRPFQKVSCADSVSNLLLLF